MDQLTDKRESNQDINDLIKSACWRKAPTRINGKEAEKQRIILKETLGNRIRRRR